MAQLKITQVISKNGTSARQKANLESLGLRRIRQTVIVEKNPVNLGMLAKIQHRVKVEEI